MNILADENVEYPIVEYLRGLGHDVLAATEAFVSTPDPEVLQHGNEQQRILLTNDLDFGELVFHQKRQTVGIVLLRLKSASLAEKLDLVAKYWPLVASELPGSFIVISRRAIRIRPLVF